jgi:hypothetical protein
MHLLKSLGNKNGFVYDNLTIHCTLGFVDPSAPDMFPYRRKGNQIQSLVLKGGFVLLLHGGFPKGMFSSLTIKIWI